MPGDRLHRTPAPPLLRWLCWPELLEEAHQVPADKSQEDFLYLAFTLVCVSHGCTVKVDTKPILLALTMSLAKKCSRQRERCTGKSEMAKKRELVKTRETRCLWLLQGSGVSDLDKLLTAE